MTNIAIFGINVAMLMTNIAMFGINVAMLMRNIAMFGTNVAMLTITTCTGVSRLNLCISKLLWDGLLARPNWRARCPPHKKIYCNILALTRQYIQSDEEKSCDR
ncbi:MAG: hypothetical protein RM022_000900 [Nostoc sp. EfeVER01]|nr:MULTISPECIES: hypothetical protein [unclassified Nostoc]MDZ7947247.1 hypothetical protein [Nostoc sp. EfeVER01]